MQVWCFSQLSLPNTGSDSDYLTYFIYLKNLKLYLIIRLLVLVLFLAMYRLYIIIIVITFGTIYV